MIYESNCRELVEEATNLMLSNLPDRPDSDMIRRSIVENAEWFLRGDPVDWQSNFFYASSGDRSISFSFTDYSDVFDRTLVPENRMKAKWLSRDVDGSEEDLIDIFLEWNKPHFRGLAAQAFAAWMFERVDFSVMADRYLDFVNGRP